jgi:hypothetical protein
MRQGRDRLPNTTKLRPYIAVVKLLSCPCGLPSVLDAQRHFGTSWMLPRNSPVPRPPPSVHPVRTADFAAKPIVPSDPKIRRSVPRVAVSSTCSQLLAYSAGGRVKVGIHPPLHNRNAGVQSGEPFYMGRVDHRPLVGIFGGRSPCQSKIRADHHSFDHERRRVLCVERSWIPGVGTVLLDFHCPPPQRAPAGPSRRRRRCSWIIATVVEPSPATGKIRCGEPAGGACGVPPGLP